MRLLSSTFTADYLENFLWIYLCYLRFGFRSSKNRTSDTYITYSRWFPCVPRRILQKKAKKRNFSLLSSTDSADYPEFFPSIYLWYLIFGFRTSKNRTSDTYNISFEWFPCVPRRIIEKSVQKLILGFFPLLSLLITWNFFR